MAPTKRKANVIGCRISTLVSYRGHTDREREREKGIKKDRGTGL